MSTNPIASLDHYLAGLKRREEALQQVKRIVAEFPDLAGEIVTALTTHVPMKAMKAEPQDGLPSRYLAIRGFFEGNGNQWTTCGDIAHFLKMPKGSASPVLWNTHTHCFEQRTKEGSRRIKEWRLKAEILSPSDNVTIIG